MVVWRGIGIRPSNCNEELAQLLIDTEVMNGGSPTEIRDRIWAGEI